jgi:hypothetical protein
LEGADTFNQGPSGSLPAAVLTPRPLANISNQLLRFMTKFYLLVTAVAASALLTGPLQGQSPDSVLAISRGGTSILRVNEDAGLVVRGASGVGAIPATGAGVRMMWYPGHYAFRAGRATGSEWDLAGVGLGSTAFGTGNTASGTNSFAIGLASIASGDNSMASGESSTASGIASLAHNGTALGERSIAIGYGALATGATATAIGPSAIAIGTGSFVGGPSTANGSYAVALGCRTVRVATTRLPSVRMLVRRTVPGRS